MRSRWLLGDPPLVPSAPRLFCFPHAGGSPSAFRSWRSTPAVDVQPVRLPGRESRISEPPRERITLLVAELVDALMPYLGDEFALFGHSMGALVAFELARSLEDLGRDPLRLFVSGKAFPNRTAPVPPVGVTEAGGASEDDTAALLRKLGATPDAVLADPTMLDAVLPAFRADLELSRTYAYRPAPLLRCPISAYYGHEDPWDDLHSMEAWAQATVGTLRLRGFTGDHFFPFGESSDDVIRAVAGELTGR